MIIYKSKYISIEIRNIDKYKSFDINLIELDNKGQAKSEMFITSMSALELYKLGKIISGYSFLFMTEKELEIMRNK